MFSLINKKCGTAALSNSPPILLATVIPQLIRLYVSGVE